METEDGSLFRREVLEHRADRLHGEVGIAVPVSWQAIGFVLLAGLAAAFVLLLTASHDRVETATGAIVADGGGSVRAELRVPSAAAGFVETGQEVRLAVDAFPSERFGMTAARISNVAAAAAPIRLADGRTVPVFLATAELERPWVEAHGRRRPLRPGMAFTAAIVTERQSLVEWLFEPLLAARAR